MTWIDSFFGHDFFISYSHADASGYARALASRLGDQSFARFLDVESMPATAPIRPTLTSALRKSSFLILLISKGSLGSEWVSWGRIELEPAVRRRWAFPLFHRSTAGRGYGVGY